MHPCEVMKSRDRLVMRSRDRLAKHKIVYLAALANSKAPVNNF